MQALTQHKYSRSHLFKIRNGMHKRYTDCSGFTVLKALGIFHARGSRAGARHTRTCPSYGHSRSQSTRRSIPLVSMGRKYAFRSTCPERTIRRRNLIPLREVAHPPWRISHSHNQMCSVSQRNFCLINSRSVRNKALILNEHITEHNIDVLGITETWLLESDTAVVAELLPSGYAMMHVPREGNVPYGGVAVIYRSDLKACRKPITSFSTFEYMHVSLSCARSVIHVVVVYRPPPSLANGNKVDDFLDEFSEFLGMFSTVSPTELIVLGDFNFHVELPADSLANKFRDLYEGFNLRQLVTCPTHQSGHTLDLILVPENSYTVCESSIHVTDSRLSDHFAVFFKVNFQRRLRNKKVVHCRRTKNIDLDAFCTHLEIKVANLNTDTNSGHEVDDMVTALFESLIASLDHFAPIQEKVVTSRDSAPWFDDNIRQARRERRSRETCYRRDPTSENLAQYHMARNRVVSAIAKAKRVFYTKAFTECSKSPKLMFRHIKALLSPSSPKSTPESDDHGKLASSFLEFFVEKVRKIRGNQPKSSIFDSAPDICGVEHGFSSFRPVSESDLCKLILESRSTTCATDPLPCRLLKAALPVLSRTLTSVVNTSLQNGVVPSRFKLATIRPLLKKADLDMNDLASYRPISTLPFLSKILERAVFQQIKEYLDDKNLLDPLQSAYRSGYSTESAVLRVQNDILQELDRKQNIILVLLDLSAAFDTVDHSLLLRRLSERIGIKGIALDWFSSYLSERKQRVLIDDQFSEMFTVQYGVPQGSVLGPILFMLYLLPLRDLLRAQSVDYHLYADDTQLYLTADPASPQPSFQKAVEALTRISEWMGNNYLKLNEKKTEILLISSRFSRHPFQHNFVLSSDDIVRPAPFVRNLGAYLSTDMSLNKHVSMLCRSISYNLRNISRVRKYLTDSAAHAAIRALVLSRLDYHNALLYGAPLFQLQRLQRMQNLAARIATCANRRDPATPLLRTLHWLPVAARIEFKVCLFVFKALGGTGPGYLRDLLHTHTPMRALRSSADSSRLVIPKTRTVSFGDRAFSAAGPRIWNSLPQHLRCASSETEFRRGLKTHFFRKYLT